MKVLMVSTTFPKDLNDWRGRFIANLVLSLSNHESCQLSLWAPPGEIPANTRYACSDKDKKILASLMRKGGIAHLIRTNIFSALIYGGAISASLYKLFKRHNAEVFHIHWMQNALFLRGNKPVVISVLGSDFRLLKWALMVRLLRSSLKKQPCILAPNSSWMEPCLKEKFGDIAEIKTIPFGIDPIWLSIKRDIHFEGGDKKWLLVSRLTQKKVGNLFSWGEGIFNKSDQLHIIGPKQEKNILIPAWAHFHGPQGPETLANQWFPSIHALITLSVHDEGLPQVILEAMASGIPVIASDIESHRTIIEHGSNGLLVSSRSELVDAIGLLSDESENMRIGHNGKMWVESNIGTWKDCANRFISAYQQVKKNSRRNSRESL